MKSATIKTVYLILMLSYGPLLNAQFNISLGASMGYSAHSDSYEFEEFFTTFQYPGWRLLEAEIRPYYNLSNYSTVIYTSFRFSPKNIVNPYQYMYGSIGIEQGFADNTLYIMGGVGPNRSWAERELSLGWLYTIGVGSKSELIRTQLSFVFGNQTNQSSFLRDQEARITAGVSFNLWNHGM